MTLPHLLPHYQSVASIWLKVWESWDPVTEIFNFIFKIIPIFQKKFLFSGQKIPMTFYSVFSGCFLYSFKMILDLNRFLICKYFKARSIAPRIFENVTNSKTNSQFSMFLFSCRATAIFFSFAWLEIYCCQ